MNSAVGSNAVSAKRTSETDVKVSIVMPVFNERAFIEEVLIRVQRVALRKEIIVVDDGSSDGTRELLQQWAVAQSKGEQEATLQDGRTLLLDGVQFLFQD